MREVAHRPRLPDDDAVDGIASLSAETESVVLADMAEQLGHVGHWQVNLPDRSLTWSAEAYRIHGVTPKNYWPASATVAEFYHPDDRPALAAALAAAARDGTSFDLVVRLIRADDELRHVRIRGVPLARVDQNPALVFGVYIDVTEQVKNERELQAANLNLLQLAYVDALTGVANRRHFNEILEREWWRAAREATALSLVMIDIDAFKAFNDLYGHLAGDACLRAVAEAVASIGRRPADLVARYGGEEFALILPVTELGGAVRLAETVLAAIRALDLTHGGNPCCGGVVTASLGVATAYPQPGTQRTSCAALIAEADALLYEAKRTGRNRVVSSVSPELEGAAPLALNEPARLAALRALERIGATERTAELDRIARLAAKLTAAPIGLVSLVGQDIQRFAGNFGLDGVESTGRDVSFCAYTILGDEPFVVADATHDVRFQENALVTGDLGLRYYAGAPIVSPTTGHRLGALCIIDRTSRAETTSAERALLSDLARMAAVLIEDRAAELRREVIGSSGG